MEFNLAAIHEAVAAAVPDDECIVTADRRLSWAEVTDRTRRLADYFRRRGLGAVVPRSDLSPWESGQDHVALYLRNCPEYIEAMLGAFKARAVSFNVNYRYVPDELRYLFADAGPKALIYHAAFAPALRQSGPLPEVLICVDDGSGETPLPGSVAYEDALAQGEPHRPENLSPDDCYLLYTGGTTGMPKGALWRQADIFVAGMSGHRRGVEYASMEEIVGRRGRRPFRLLPLPPLIHGASQWMAFTAFNTGGVVILPGAQFDADEAWAVAEREGATSIAVVGDAFGRPLLASLRRRPPGMLPALRTINNGGAMLSPAVKEGLLDLLPHIRIVDSVGSSEAGVAGLHGSTPGAVATGVFPLGRNGAVLSADKQRRISAPTDEEGWLATSGRIPLGYLGDAEKTTATFPEVDGVRYAVPGDRVRLVGDDLIELLGRESVTINTGGEKVFAEEVEGVLAACPGVVDVIVVGRPSLQWGQEVVALLAVGDEVTDQALRAVCAAHLAGYKVPKAFVRVPHVQRSPSGKPDYGWATAQVNP
jgi:3-oxocholest-4-en-26-oate---CoA ligase